MKYLSTSKMKSQELRALAEKLLNEVEEKDKRIERLKDIICAHQIADETGYIDGVGFIEGFPQMDEESTNIFNSFKLEQQAKGVEDALKAVPPTRAGNWNFQSITEYLKQLREQEKEDEKYE